MYFNCLCLNSRTVRDCIARTSLEADDPHRQLGDHASWTYSGRPSSSMQLSARTAMATSIARRSSVHERSPPLMTRLKRNIRLHLGSPTAACDLLPAHASALGNGLQVLVSLGWYRSGHRTRHSAGPGWHDHGSSGLLYGDLAVDAVFIVGTVGGEGGDWVRDLVEHGTDL